MLLLIALVVASAVAQNCSTGSTCLNCASQPGCGWCSASRTCLPGNAQGPIGGYCEPAGKLWNFGTCPTCGSYTNCRACTLANGDCSFCPATNQCVSYDDASCPTKLASCPCTQYNSCSTCTLLSNNACRWCPSAAGGGCIDDTANCTTGTPATACPCVANKNCDQCLSDFNGNYNNECSWCGAALGCQDKGGKTCTVATLSCPAKCAELTAGGCKKCLAGDGCAWCADMNVCTDAASGACFASHTCPEDHCGKFHSCDTCNERSEQGCSWCVEQTNTSTTMSCKSTLPGTPNQCTGKTNTSCTDFCHAQHKCEDCQIARGCAWCSINDTAKCVNFDIQTNEIANCAIKLACSADAGGLNTTGSFFLGAFVSVVVVALVGGVTLYYRRRKASQYSALK